MNLQVREPFDETVTFYGGNWKRRYCRRRGHVEIVALTTALTLQLVCLRCHAAGDIEGIVTTFARTPPDPRATARETTEPEEGEYV